MIDINKFLECLRKERNAVAIKLGSKVFNRCCHTFMRRIILYYQYVEKSNVCALSTGSTCRCMTYCDSNIVACLVCGNYYYEYIDY